MSDWYWRIIALKAAFVLTCFVSYLRAEEIQKLPFCNPHIINEDSGYKDLVIVSTLDGKLTAFSTNNGAKAWDVQTQPLLSSNLHNVELTSGGKWVRLVPSLRGTLYSLSGDTVEPLPFDAEQLLSSSFKYSDDLVIAGSRETLWTGVDRSSGRVLYECGSLGCSSEQQAPGDVLVLRRLASTVRAVDPRQGHEKWNFSVAEHQLALSSSRECLGASQGPKPLATVAVALPEGVVAVKKPNSNSPLWQQKLDAPIADVWQLQNGLLHRVDVLLEATRSLVEGGDTQLASPSLYIGVHNTQLYIQENALYPARLETAVSPAPWRLRHSLAAAAPRPDSTALSLVTLYGNTKQTGDHGFFLYLQESCDQAVQVSPEIEPDIIQPNDSSDPEHHHIHVHVYSLWFWWKEVLLIAISSALLMNLMIWPRFFAPRLRPSSPLPVNQEYIVVERHYERPQVTEYVGRYETDFTPLRCLGRGGFGVVFEAKNNIDHCSYAVKRITLPRRESKRERVLREVRALAKLEHDHIVRYFNAWLEEPPPAWQENRDRAWLRELEGVSVLSDDYDATSPLPKSPTIKDDSVKLTLQKTVDHCIDALDYEKQLDDKTKRHRSLSCNDSFSIVFDENASKDHVTHTKSSTKYSLSDITPPSALSKNLPSGDHDADDSFIVFAHTNEGSGLSEARVKGTDVSIDKRLERVKECDELSKVDSRKKKKKKGHTRHWSLDMVVKSTDSANVGGSKMYLYIQMQLCLRDSLHDWLRQNNTVALRKNKNKDATSSKATTANVLTKMTEAYFQGQVQVLFSQILSAVEYVHLAGLIHRDLKPSNIFFAPDGRVKVGDFGLVTTMSDSSQGGDAPETINVQSRHTYRVGTHLYMSPEQLSGGSYSYKVDIFSLGLVLFELLQPFGTESERVASLLKARTQIYDEHFVRQYPNETEVLKLMLSEDPSQRPTASGVRARAPLYEHTDESYHFTLPGMPS